MRNPRLLSEFSLRIYSGLHGKVELKNDFRMRTHIFQSVFATAGMPVYRELSQVNYDKAITDKHIRGMVFDVGPTSREGLAETEMLSGITKTFDDVQNGPIKNKNLGKLKRIMIVDDEEDVTFLFKLILEGKHRDVVFSCKVDSFNESLVALENYREGLYDLIIIDIVMPRMNGLRLYKEIRKKDKRVKVCFLTAGETYYEEYTVVTLT